jgi:murein DD-endopeptidase MepM/ murein hydrolase activator NlpD
VRRAPRPALTALCLLAALGAAGSAPAEPADDCAPADVFCIPSDPTTTTTTTTTTTATTTDATTTTTGDTTTTDSTTTAPDTSSSGNGGSEWILVPPGSAESEPAGGQPSSKPETGAAGAFPRLGPQPDTPALGGGPYVFPVYGPASFVDTFGAPRADVSWHHGDDIFAPLGSPILAVAEGALFSVGWNRIGGNRLWLRDREGNYFYYAHLAAFSTTAVNGAKVHAGDVIGFVGNTGDAAGTPYHLHFEIHPVGLLGLGYDGAVDPTTYLRRWRHAGDLGGAAPAGIGWSARTAPPAGAILLTKSDISSADGLEPESLGRALSAEGAPDSVAMPVDASPPNTTSQRRSVAGVRDFDGVLPDEMIAASPWDRVAGCESNGRWSTNTGNGFFGGLQFEPGTWRAFGGEEFAPSAQAASREQQIAVAQRVLRAQGWLAWPACSAKLGLR